MFSELSSGLPFAGEHVKTGLTQVKKASFPNFLSGTLLLTLVLGILPSTAQDHLIIPSLEFPCLSSSGGNVLWLCSNSFLTRVDQNGIAQFNLKTDLHIDTITSIAANQDGGVWLGGDFGVGFFNGTVLRRYTFKDGLFDKQIHQVYCSCQGHIWVATSSGPFVLLDNHFYVFEPLKNKKVLRVFENDRDWIFLTSSGFEVSKKQKRFFRSRIFLILVTILGLGLMSAGSFFWFRRFKTHVEWKANLIRVEQQGLLAQMNPHFIFNALNSVQRYIMNKDQESAHDYLQKFSSMMRKVLENSCRPTIVLSEEIEMLNLYLQIESLRFDQGFDFEISVKEDDIWQLEIPTMLIQPFVENAIWHGLMNKATRGKISLTFSKLNEKLLRCEIQDNGIGRKKAEDLKSKASVKHKSRGTDIIRKRIELLNLKSRQKINCDTIDLETQGQGTTGTLVRLVIPVSQV